MGPGTQQALIAVYDLDRTLTRRGSWVPWLRFWLRHEAPWRRLLLPLLLVPALAFALRLIGRGTLKMAVQGVVMGHRVPVARVEAAAARFAASFVADAVWPAAHAALAADAAAGRRRVIASASMDYYVIAIARSLGLDPAGGDAVLATRALLRRGRVLARLASPNCYGTEKAARLSAWLAAEGLAGQPFDFASDHESDAPCLGMAAASGGQPLAVNPSPALAALAARRGWPVRQWGPVEASLFERA